MEMTMVKKASKGDKQSLKQLIKINSEYIYKLAFLHTKYEDDAKIIMENTILYIYDNIHKISKSSNFKNTITKITINEINEYLEEFGMIDIEDKNLEIINCNKIDLYRAVDFLSIDLKNVVILTYFCNFSTREVGDILNIKESTVKMYLRKSLKIMKENLKEHL